MEIKYRTFKRPSEKNEKNITTNAVFILFRIHITQRYKTSWVYGWLITCCLCFHFWLEVTPCLASQSRWSVWYYDFYSNWKWNAAN